MEFVIVIIALCALFLIGLKVFTTPKNGAPEYPLVAERRRNIRKFGTSADTREATSSGEVA